jgi:hypothetical protein
MRYSIFILLLVVCSSCGAQKEQKEAQPERISLEVATNNDPLQVATWKFSAESTNEVDVYLVKANLSLANDWHIFDFEPGGDGYLIAPDISFTTEGLTVISKKAVGELVTAKLAGMEKKVRYYENKVSFEVRVRSKEKDIKGSVYYQLCDHEKCLAPTDQSFSLTLK